MKGQDLTQTLEKSATLPPGPLRRWVLNHDDSWLFIVPYIGLAVVLSIALSLFWLVAIVGAHFALEWLRQVYLAREAGLRLGTLDLLGRVLWELRLDIVLIIFALALAVYMEFTLGVVGLGSATRAGAMAGARAGARFVVIQRVLRGVLLSVDDLAQVARVVLLRKKAAVKDEPPDDDAQDPQAAAPDLTPGWRKPWSRWDYALIGAGALLLALMAAAPLITDHSYESMLLTLTEELHPFPVKD